MPPRHPRRAASVDSIIAIDGVSDDETVKRRVFYLMSFRVVLMSLVLGITLILSWASDFDLTAANSLCLFAIIATTYALTIVYAIGLKRGIRPRRLADAQIAADLVTTTVLVHVTGGAQSAYSFFFPLSIIGAATIRYRRGALTALLASAFLYGAVSLLGWADLLPVPLGQRVLPNELTAVELIRALGLNLAAFAGVAFLAFGLGSQIQHTSASLETQRTVTADIYAVHEDIVRCLPSGLITVDRRHRVLTVNEAACEILEMCASDVLGTPIDRIMPGLEDRLLQLAPRAMLRRGDLTIERDDGSEKNLGISVSPLRDNRDRILGRIVHFQDLTELRAMEAQIKSAERLAIIGALAAGVAHEIRNPLASISGSIELLATSPARREEGRALMDIMTREIDRLNTMITELLDYSNPPPPKLVRFNLAELVAETLAVFHQDRDFADVRVTRNNRGPASGLVLCADPGKLRQVLWNLLRNAAEAARDGGRQVVVSVAGSENHVELCVEDDGPGLDPSVLPRVFDPFFTTKSQGSGLGLAICHSIVLDHGGRIRAENLAVGGCRFVVELPRNQPGSSAGDLDNAVAAPAAGE